MKKRTKSVPPDSPAEPAKITYVTCDTLRNEAESLPIFAKGKKWIGILGEDAPAKSRRGGVPELPICREEWDFSQCPDDELLLCKFYEYARQLEVWHWIAGHARRLEKAQRASDLGEQGHKVGGPGGVFLSGTATVQAILTLFPEFPSTPWLRLDKATRQHRLKELGSPIQVPPLAMAKDLDIPNEFEDPAEASVTVLTTTYDCTIARLSICWNYTDAQIMKAFQAWLQSARCAPEPPKHTGKLPNQGDVLRADLQALAAYRLMQHLTVTQAQKHVANAFRDFPEARFYTTVRSWRRGKQKAERLIAGLAEEGGSLFILLRML